MGKFSIYRIDNVVGVVISKTCWIYCYTDIQRLNNDQSRHCLRSLANKIFSSALISREVQKSPSFIASSTILLLECVLMTECFVLDNHCLQFKKACFEVVGTIAKAARVL